MNGPVVTATEYVNLFLIHTNAHHKISTTEKILKNQVTRITHWVGVIEPLFSAMLVMAVAGCHSREVREGGSGGRSACGSSNGGGGSTVPHVPETAKCTAPTLVQPGRTHPQVQRPHALGAGVQGGAWTWGLVSPAQGGKWEQLLPQGPSERCSHHGHPARFLCPRRGSAQNHPGPCVGEIHPTSG